MHIKHQMFFLRHFPHLLCEKLTILKRCCIKQYWSIPKFCGFRSHFNVICCINGLKALNSRLRTLLSTVVWFRSSFCCPKYIQYSLMSPFGRNGCFRDTLIGMDKVACALTFRGLLGPTTYIKQIRVAVFTLRTSQPANDIHCYFQRVNFTPVLEWKSGVK